MGSPAGVDVKCAWKKATTWGTAVACGANDGVLILPDNFDRDAPAQLDDSLGLFWPQDSDPGAISAKGDLPMYLRYDGCDLGIAMAMGATGGAPVQQAATTAYQQTFTLASVLDGLFLTGALNKKVNIEELPSMKLLGFTISGQVGEPITITFQTLPSNLITNSVVNTTTTFNNVTYREIKNRVLFRQGLFRMNDQSGIALASPAADIYPKSFELSFKRKLAGVYGAGGSFDIIDEPTNDGTPEVSLKLDFPRHVSAAYQDAWITGTAKKLDMVFTGALIQSTYYRKWTFEFPNLKIKKASAPTKAGMLDETVEFDCLGCSAAPTGMTGLTLPFRATVINTLVTNVLA
jgi:hypothetical protein